MTSTTYDFIDVSFHNATFPATYQPPGLLLALGLQIGGANAGSSYTTASMISGPFAPSSGNTSVGVVLPGLIAQGPGADVIAGTFPAAGNVTVIPVGFFPTKIEIIDWTGVVKWEWLYGAPAATAPASDILKTVTGGTETVDSSDNAITIVADAAGGNGDVCYILLAAAVAVSGHTLSFRIEQ